jgi:hypothetical protein
VLQVPSWQMQQKKVRSSRQSGQQKEENFTNRSDINSSPDILVIQFFVRLCFFCRVKLLIISLEMIMSVVPRLFCYRFTGSSGVCHMNKETKNSSDLVFCFLS